MFERFTTSARTAVTLAQQEARVLDRPSIGTEHLLIGLAGDGPDPAAQVLRAFGATAATLRAAARDRHDDGLDADALALLGIDLDRVRRVTEERFGRGALDASWMQRSPKGHLPFSAASKRAMAEAVSQAVSLRAGSISSGHLLLGLVADADGSAVQVLRSCAVDIGALRAEVVALLGSEAA